MIPIISTLADHKFIESYGSFLSPDPISIGLYCLLGWNFLLQ
ncbi:hypothetical protein PL10110_300057 [Planktothrix agardhii]|nr:hypothetical protein PL10110_300057 [Planktothrix agardhii]